MQARSDEPPFVTYLPMDRRQALARDIDLPRRTTGAVLFADIAGFTQLSGRLTAALGPRRGVDELSGLLHSVYEVLLHEVHERAGSVIGFSGDAVLCWFGDAPLGPHGRPAIGAHRAVAAGRRMHDVLRALPVVEPDGGPPVTIGVKVAVTTGPVTRLLVGDPAHQLIEVLGGATVKRIGDLAVALDRVVVDDATLVALGRSSPTGADERGGSVLDDDVVVDVEPTPWPSSVDAALAKSVVGAWVGRQVRQRGTGPTELRPTVAMFVDVRSLDLDHDAAAPELLDRFVRWVQGVIAATDGNLLQVTLGDKDTYLYVSFGAPRAHEDLATRAALAALSLRDLPADLAGIGPLRIGIAHGVTRVGAYGSSTHGTYGALGDGTNLAARLMTSAPPGAIVMSARVAEACDQGFVVEPGETVVAKGFTEPVEVVRLTGRAGWVTASRAHRRRLVGRDRELAVLAERLGRVNDGAAGTTVVRGEPGVGKSHLVAEAKRRLLSEATVTWLDCRVDAHTTTALAPFVALLRDLTFQELASVEDDRRALFETIVHGLCADLGALGDDEADRLAARLSDDRSFLGALVGLHWPASPYEVHDPRTRLDRCLETYVELLRAESRRRPVVLHVDDGHWLDIESRQLLGRIERCADHERLGVLVSERPTVGDDQGDDALVVGPLDRDGVIGVTRSRLGGEAAADLVDLLVARSQGNPLFVDQLALALQERGWVAPGHDGAWSLRGQHDHELPVSLTTLLVSRLDGLEADVRDVVQCGAVLGREVELGVLAHMVDAESDGSVDAAADAGIWDVDDSGGRMVFRHELLRDAAYQMQPDARLRSRHAMAARALVAVHGEDDALAAELADHHERAGEPAAAFTQLLRAAAVAARLPAHHEVRTHLRRAGALAAAAHARDEEIAAVHLGLADVAVALGEYGVAVEELTSASALAITATTRVELLCRTGETYERWGRLADAEAAYEDAVMALQLAPAPSLAGRIYGGLAMVSGQRGDHDAAAELAELASIFASDSGESDQIAEANHRLATVALQRGDLDAADDHARRSLSMFTESGRVGGRAAAFNNLGLIAARRGDSEEAIRRLGEAVSCFEAVGNEPALARALGNLGDAYQDAGRSDDSMACLQRAVSILARIGLDEQGVVTSMWKAGSW